MFQVSMTDHQVTMHNTKQPSGNAVWYINQGQIPYLVKALTEAAAALSTRAKPTWDIPDIQ